MKKKTLLVWMFSLGLFSATTDDCILNAISLKKFDVLKNKKTSDKEKKIAKKRKKVIEKKQFDKKRVFPILIYGNSFLRGKNRNIYSLNELIELMYETMYQADGVGLAATQIGLKIRFFVVDGRPSFEILKEKTGKEEPQLLDLKKVFINPKIIRYFGEKQKFIEGCLSIPGIPVEVERNSEIEIEYFDEKWEKHRKIFSGFAARIIQHEYDHIEGRLIIDYLPEEKKEEIRLKLEEISKGEMKEKIPYQTKLNKR